MLSVETQTQNGGLGADAIRLIHDENGALLG